MDIHRKSALTLPIMITMLAIMVTGALAAAECISFDVFSADHSIITTSGGEVIHMEGFTTNGAPGSPLLPRKVFDVALPPDVNWDSVAIRAQDTQKSVINGRHSLKPASPGAIWDEEGNQVLSWGGAGPIVDGKDISIYGRNEDYPNACAAKLNCSQMRKWKFVRVEFTSFAINPVTQRLTLVSNARIVVQFERTGAQEPPALLRDTVMDDLARQRFVNFDEASSWYETSQKRTAKNGSKFDYVIITTNAIEASSAKLAGFVSHKTAWGLSPLVITEDEFGGLTGQAPDGTAEKIRQWLMENYASYQVRYVLLIGNPDAESGDIPMKKCWPRYHESWERIAETDYFYADLTGNWDLNGDTFFGQYKEYPDGDRGEHEGEQGIDLTAEVFVGRIPIYGNSEDDFKQLDDILQKTIDYQAAAGDLSWRRKILLPESFSDSSTDGAYLAERMMDDYLTTAGFSPYKLYQQGSCHDHDDSTYDSDEELVGDATWNHWKQTANAYGLVTWWAHGDAWNAYVGYGGGHWCGGYLMQSENCASLDDTKPAIVYQCSCSTASPEYDDNLSYSLLKSGAIAAVGATRGSWYKVGWTGPTGMMYNVDLGYEMNKNLTELSYPVGKALAVAKSTLSPTAADTLYMNAFGFNVYGDPEIHNDQCAYTYITLDSFEAVARKDSSTLLRWVTGTEIGTAGFDLYRSETPDFESYEKVNPRIIEPTGSPVAGAEYEVLDRSVRPGTLYYYFLVEIDVNGKRSTFGPVQARARIRVPNVFEMSSAIIRF